MLMCITGLLVQLVIITLFLISFKNACGISKDCNYKVELVNREVNQVMDALAKMAYLGCERFRFSRD